MLPLVRPPRSAGITASSRPRIETKSAAFEIEGGVIRARYVVRNPEKLRHLS
jgi:hypothetical protein